MASESRLRETAGPITSEPNGSLSQPSPRPPGVGVRHRDAHNSSVLRQLAERSVLARTGLPRQTEATFADDVALHLIGPAVDGWTR